MVGRCEVDDANRSGFRMTTGIGGTRPMNSFVEEAIDEALGTSRHKWALIVVALVAGATAAFWLTNRGHGRNAAVTGSDDEPT